MNGSGATTKPAATETLKWVEEFRKSAHERIRTAQDPDAEFQRIQKELTLQFSIAELIRDKMAAAQAQPAATTAPPKNITLTLKDLKKLKKRVLDSATKNWNLLDEGAEQKLAPTLGAVADWLERQEGGRP
jgi:hypothetical protein